MPNTSSHTPNLEPDALQSAAELLPWLINDSLEGDEAEAVLSALEGSEDVAGELAATGEMFWLTGQHVPSLALAEYALDLPLSELSREEIELHLESCSACRAEMALIASENVEEDTAPIEIAPVLDFATAPRRPVTVAPAPRRPVWRRYALAATLAATVVGALLVQVGGQLESPVVGLQDIAQVGVEEPAKMAEEILRNPTPETALFTDGFESGDTGSWSIVSN